MPVEGAEVGLLAAGEGGYFACNARSGSVAPPAPDGARGQAILQCAGGTVMMNGVDQVSSHLSLVSPDVLRIQIPLPFPPGEVNAWLLRDGNGWTLIDSGIDDPATRALFEHVLASPLLEGRPIARLLVTHFHPDHIGLAGWLHEKTGLDLHMTRLEFMQARLLLLEDSAAEMAHLLAHVRRCGAPQEFLDFLPVRGTIYPKWVGPLPHHYLRVEEGDAFTLYGTTWRVMIGEGHAPEMICLYSAGRSMLISADQILGRISPHIGSYASDPVSDPLAAFLASLTKFGGLARGHAGPALARRSLHGPPPAHRRLARPPQGTARQADGVLHRAANRDGHVERPVSAPSRTADRLWPERGSGSSASSLSCR